MTGSIKKAWEEIAALTRRDFVYTGAAHQTEEQERLTKKWAEHSTVQGWVVSQRAIEEAARVLVLASAEALIVALAVGDPRSMEQIEAAAEPVMRETRELGAKP